MRDLAPLGQPLGVYDVKGIENSVVKIDLIEAMG